MFVLDTNVLSVLMAAQPPREVASWVSAQSEDLLFTAAVCQAEILSGWRSCPKAAVARSWKQPPGRCSWMISRGEYSLSIRSQPRVTQTCTLGAGERADQWRPRI
jgi:hypothetical protein